MTPESPSRWADVRAATEAALALPLELRPGFLDQACGADAALRAEVEAQIRACERAANSPTFLAEPAATFAAPLFEGAASTGTSTGGDADTPTASDRATPALGMPAALRTALAGRYEVERELGRGGTATVYLARDLRHNRRVALKVLDPALGAAVSAERFLREIRVMAALTHPHVLPLHDSRDAAGLLYYVMPYVEGETLRDRLNRTGSLPSDAVLRLVREVASALAYAHRQGVVHRDIKPANILLADGHAVVADFGIARALREAREPSSDSVGEDGSSFASGAGTDTLTEAGTSPGTPAYMAPEQLRGDADVDQRADLYALGVVAYEALAGEHPFGARSARRLVEAHLTELPPELAARRLDVPPALLALVMQLLAKDPADRPQSAEEVLRALDGEAATLPAPATARRRIPIAVAVIVATVLGAGGYMLSRRAESDVARVRLRAAGAPPVRHPARDSLAYEQFLKGQYEWMVHPGSGDTDAVRYFEQAVARDPGYAAAWAGLADAYTRLTLFGTAAPRPTFAKASAAASRALALDSTLAAAHVSLGQVRMLSEYAWEEADGEYLRAMKLDSSYSFARDLYAVSLASRGRYSEAEAQLDTVRMIDPLAHVNANLPGRLLVTVGRLDEAIRVLRHVVEVDPQASQAYQQLGQAYLLKRMVPEAIAALQRAAVLSGPRDSAELAYAFAVTGRRAEAERVLRALLAPSHRGATPSYHIAMAYAGLGDRDAAFRWLDRGYAERAPSMGWVRAEPGFATLHADARWPALLRRMHLTP